MEHGALLLEWIVIARTGAKAIAKIVIVNVGFSTGERLLGMYTLLSRIGVRSERAGDRCRQASGSAIAGEVALRENFNESVVAVALDRAGVADAGGFVWRVHVFRRRVAGKAREDTLLERSKHVGTRIKGLEDVLMEIRTERSNKTTGKWTDIW